MIDKEFLNDEFDEESVLCNLCHGSLIPDLCSCPPCKRCGQRGQKGCYKYFAPPGSLKHHGMELNSEQMQAIQIDSEQQENKRRTGYYFPD